MGEFSHKPLYIAVMVTSTVTMCMMFLVNAMSSAPDVFPGVFLKTVAEISDAYYIEITPAGWTFSIWGVIYFWQVLFMGYSLSTICRPGVSGYLYYSPNHNPIWIFAIYILNNLINITWLFMFDREWMLAAFFMLSLIVCTLIACLVISFIYLDRNVEVLQKNGMMKEVWMTRLMVQNGLAVYCTWVSVATLLNLAFFATYNAGNDQSAMSTLALCFLGVEIILWVSLDTFLLDRYTRYLFSPHFVLVWALTGSFTKNFVTWNTNSIITVVLLTLACMALVSKIIIMFWRHFRQRSQTQLVSPAPSPELGDKEKEADKA